MDLRRLGFSREDVLVLVALTLTTLTSLNKEVRPFFLGDNSIWSFPSVSSLGDYRFGSPEGYFSLAIIAFGAFGLIVPNYSLIA